MAADETTNGNDITSENSGEASSEMRPTQAPGAAELSPDEQRLQALTDERDKVRNQLLRTAADYDNFRKRARKELQDAVFKTREDVLTEVLPVIDNLERAQQSISSSSSMESIVDGISMVLRGFQDTAQRMDLKRLSSVGMTFDPNLHDAVQQVETTEHPPGTVISEVLPGYQLGDRLLRPALVVVAKSATAKRAAAPDSSADLPTDSNDQASSAETDSQE